MKNISLKHLSAYLPYQVKATFKETTDRYCRKYVIGTVGAVYDGSKEPTIVCFDTVNATPDKFKLLLRPMSALDEKALSDINCDLMDQIKMEQFRDKEISLFSMPYGVIQILLSHHYDVFDLIKRGMAEEYKN